MLYYKINSYKYTMASKNAKRQDFQNQRTKEKIILFINQKYEDPNDIVQLEEVVQHLKSTYSELQRKSEKELQKMVKWQFDNIVQAVTGTNIQKAIFKLRDFNEELHQEYVNNGMTPVKKREGKALLKE